MPDLDLIVTQGPYSTFLAEVAAVGAVSGIRLNTIMPIAEGKLQERLIELRRIVAPKTLWIDLKARQLRIVAFANTPYTAVTISHAIRVRVPTTIYLDNGSLTAKLVAVDGNRLILEDYVGRLLGPGESVNILDESLEFVEPEIFTPTDRAYIEACRAIGLRHLMLSFVESPDDVVALRALYPECVVMAKIESKRGLANIATIAAEADELMAARGDLYTELDYPHEIGAAMAHILEVGGPDRAVAASRMLESLLRHPMPSCPDVMDLLYLRAMGYRRFLIGDSICFKRDLLMQALRIFTAIYAS